MARYFNITGASSAAAELTRELLAPGDDVRVTSISLTNIQGKVPCTVDLYIEKQLTGKFYILKDTPLLIGSTFTHDFTFDNSANQYGLYLKLNKTSGEIPSVDVILK